MPKVEDTVPEAEPAEEEEEALPEPSDAPEEPKDPTMHIQEPDEEDEMWEKVTERKMGYVMPPRPARGSKVSN
jgi:hypothetical protein